MKIGSMNSLLKRNPSLIQHSLGFGILLTSLFLNACNKTSRTTSTDDAVPVGTLIFQGSFSGANGKTCTGSCKVYQSTTNLGVFTVRLESMSIESDGSSLDVVSTINGTDTNISDLSALSGSKNYNYNPGVGAYTFTSTKIQKESNGTVFCEALLAAVP